VLAELFASPPYTAVIECAPTARELVVNVAKPEPFNGPVPRVVAPSLNVTVPVGVPEPAVTAAVKVTGEPNVAGFALEVKVVVVVCITFCVKTADVLVMSSVSPP
jgi:hypothetical protein